MDLGAAPRMLRLVGRAGCHRYKAKISDLCLYLKRGKAWLSEQGWYREPFRPFRGEMVLFFFR